ncbi:MAG: energy transducer TonB [Bryobacteraceae bacterium]
MKTFIIALALVFGGTANAQIRVFSDHGEIVLKHSKGTKQTLTSTGRDNFPSITCDGTLVLFARHAHSDEFSNQIYSIDLVSRETALVFAGPIRYHGQDIHDLTQPQLDESKRSLYLVAKTSITSGVIVSVDLQTKQISEIAEGIGFTLLARGRHAGQLVAYQRKTSITGSVYYVYWLYSRTGEALGIAGPGDMDLTSLTCQSAEEDTTGVVNPPSPPLGAVITATPVSGAPLQVDGETMSRRLKFRVVPKYPIDARGAHLEGAIRLQVRVAIDGRVADVKLISGYSNLAQSAMAAVRQWKYEPTIYNGHAVEVITVVEIPLSEAQ